MCEGGINGNKQWISWKRCKKIRWFRISSATIQPSLLARFLGNLGLHKWAVDYQNQVWESLTKQYTGIKCRNFWTLSLEYSYISNNNTYIYMILYIYYIYIYYTAQVFFVNVPMRNLVCQERRPPPKPLKLCRKTGGYNTRFGEWCYPAIFWRWNSDQIFGIWHSSHIYNCSP